MSDLVAAHEDRLQRLDPLLPAVHPLPPLAEGDALLRADGAVGIARRTQVDVSSLAAAWTAADSHRLLARIDGGDPAAGMARLLVAWRERVAALAAPGDPDSEAVITWPSRDAAMTQVFLDFGLIPLTVIAARPAGRPRLPAAATNARIRPLREDDIDDAVALHLEEIRWDAQFGSMLERPSTAQLLQREYRTAVSRDEPWSWVAELGGRVIGLVLVTPPEQAAGFAPLVAVAPAAYLYNMVVAADQRGAGVGAALVDYAHATIDAAGVGVTLLHYAGLNPLAGPFWHRCGYRPLWTNWEIRPATRLGAAAAG